MNYTFEISEELSKRFDIALQLTGESKDAVIESMMKTYVIQVFSKTASSYRTEEQGEKADKYFGKAIQKIPKWALKPKSVPSKIIRAYLKIAEENEYVYYSDLMRYCSDSENYPDEYVVSFANNFAQMKIDSEKSHGKVFEVNSMQKVVLWDNVKEIIMENKEKIMNPSTAVGYVNRNGQMNLGRTERRGTDHGQWLYRMRCEHCLHEYHANGTDIHIKKCPACQGGADTGEK